MKIAYFTNCFTPKNNGVVVSLKTFTEGLKNYDCEILIVAPKYKGYKEKDEENILRVKGIMMKGYSIHASFDSDVIEKISDAEIFNLQHPPFNYLDSKSIATRAFDFARENGKKIIFHNHTRYDLYAVEYMPFLNILHDSMIKRVREDNVYLCNQSDAVISPSRSMRDLLIEWGVKSRIEVIPTPVDSTKFEKGDRKKIRERYGITEDEILFFYVGRIGDEKKISELAETVHDLPKNIKLMFVGDGNKRKNLEKKFREIVFTGFFPHNEIQDYYAAGDIFGSMSSTETQGIVFSEAQTAGKPIIAMDVIGAKDVVDEETGFLVGSGQEFKEKLIYLANNKELLKKMSSEARKKATETRKEDEIEKIYNLYQSLLAKNI